MIYLLVFLISFTEFFIEFTGSLAAMLETLVPLPQFYNIYKSKNTNGLRYFKKQDDDLLLAGRRHYLIYLLYN